MFFVFIQNSKFRFRVIWIPFKFQYSGLYLNIIESFHYLMEVYKLNEFEVTQIPKNARIHTMIRNKNTNFIDLQVKESIDDDQIKDYIRVVFNDKTKQICYLVQKKNYTQIFDCFDAQKQLIRDFFICKICHDVFSNSGGNASRHALQHLSKEQNERDEFNKNIRLFMYETAQPFTILEKQSFQNLFKFKLPSVESFHNSMAL